MAARSRALRRSPRLILPRRSAVRSSSRTFFPGVRGLETVHDRSGESGRQIGEPRPPVTRTKSQRKICDDSENSCSANCAAVVRAPRTNANLLIRGTTCAHHAITCAVASEEDVSGRMKLVAQIEAFDSRDVAACPWFQRTKTHVRRHFDRRSKSMTRPESRISPDRSRPRSSKHAAPMHSSSSRRGCDGEARQAKMFALCCTL